MRGWRTFCLVLLCGACWATRTESAVLSPDELSEMSASGLLREAALNLSSENYGAALPCLEGYLDRMKGSDDTRVLAMSQEVRLKLGKIMAYLDDPFTAIDYLEQYNQQLPCYKPREGLKLLAVNYYEAGLYNECVSATTNALAAPLPRFLAKDIQQVRYEDMSEDELAGFTVRQMERLDRELGDQKDSLSADLSGEVPEAEPSFSKAERVLLHMTLGNAYAELHNWEASLAPYRFVIDNAANESHRGHATLQMVNALIGLERYKEAGQFVIQLYRTQARYDIRVNMALMSAASALSEAGERESALMLYRMILPRQKLAAYQTEKMNQIRREAGLPSVIVKVVSNQQGRVEASFEDAPVANVSTDRSGVAAVLPPKPMELVRLEDLVGVLVSLPPYETEVLYRAGSLYAEEARPWEAVSSLKLVAERDLEGPLGQRAFAEMLLVLTDPLQKYDRVEKLGRDYLYSHVKGLGPRMVAHALTGAYQKQKHWADIKKLRPVLDQFVPSDHAAVLQYECELYYMQAVADLMLFDYKKALTGFADVLQDFPNSHQQENATYWHAISQTFLKKYDEALSEFNAYRAAYPDGAWLPEAAFHSGICLFSTQRPNEALARFTEVTDLWPDAFVYPDACSLRGDIYASQGLLDEAQRDYEEAIATARNVKQDTYAVFQLVAMFELEARYPEMITAVETYLERRAENADVAKAAYWIGKTKLAQGRTDEAVAAYLDVIVRYGSDVSQDGVDLIIVELTKVAKQQDQDFLKTLEENLRQHIAAAEKPTLKLRLQVLLSQITNTERELGRSLMTELADLTLAPPPVLSVLCKASLAAEDYSRADEIFEIFQTRYDGSDFMRAAFKLSAYGCFAAEDWVGAMKRVKEAQSLYGWQAEAVWAQLMEGRIELARGNWDAARRAFLELMGVREWRGEPYAEACYLLGETEEKAGNPRQAFAWYQRTYVQYKGYAEGYWAAEGYLASARCLQAMGRENDRRNTYRAMLFNKYVNKQPGAAVAREVLGPAEVLEIRQWIEQGIQTNLTVTVRSEEAK